jgi:hypothetical protein
MELAALGLAALAVVYSLGCFQNEWSEKSGKEKMCLDKE